MTCPGTESSPSDNFFVGLVLGLFVGAACAVFYISELTNWLGAF